MQCSHKEQYTSFNAAPHFLHRIVKWLMAYPSCPLCNICLRWSSRSRASSMISGAATMCAGRHNIRSRKSMKCRENRRFPGIAWGLKWTMPRMNTFTPTISALATVFIRSPVALSDKSRTTRNRLYKGA